MKELLLPLQPSPPLASPQDTILSPAKSRHCPQQPPPPPRQMQPPPPSPPSLDRQLPPPVVNIPLAAKIVTPPTPVNRAPEASVKAVGTAPTMPNAERSGSTLCLRRNPSLERQDSGGKREKQKDAVAPQDEMDSTLVDEPVGVEGSLGYVEDRRGVVSFPGCDHIFGRGG